MKNIFFASLLFVSGAAFAEGIITLKQPLASNRDYKSEFSLFIVEKIDLNWAYQSWTGITMGEYAVRKSEHSLLYTIKEDIQLGPYVGVGYDGSTKLAEQYAGAMLQMKVWK